LLPIGGTAMKINVPENTKVPKLRCGDVLVSEKGTPHMLMQSKEGKTYVLNLDTGEVARYVDFYEDLEKYMRDNKWVHYPKSRYDYNLDITTKH
jgi:hypothetical protein